MNLNIKQRVLLISILPEKGNRLEMTAVRAIRKKLDFSTEEIKKNQISEDESNNVTWKVDTSKDIKLEASELVILKKRLTEFDQEGNIDDNLLDLFELLKL
jgi:hypothetical protein